MNDPFEKKVRAAAVAGWWVVLIAVGFLTRYLGRLPRRHVRSPGWLLTMWGPGVDWAFRPERVVLGSWCAFKFCVWLLILVVLWLTLWARQLRKLDRQGAK